MVWRSACNGEIGGFDSLCRLSMTGRMDSVEQMVGFAESWFLVLVFIVLITVAVLFILGMVMVVRLFRKV